MKSKCIISNLLFYVSIVVLNCKCGLNNWDSRNNLTCTSDSLAFPLICIRCFDSSNRLREQYYEENGLRVWSMQKFSADGDLIVYEMYNHSGELITWANYEDGVSKDGRGDPLAMTSFSDTAFAGDTVSIYFYCAAPPGSDMLFQINMSDGKGFLQKAFNHDFYDFIRVQKIIIPDTSGSMDFSIRMWDGKGMFRDTAEFGASIVVINK